MLCCRGDVDKSCPYDVQMWSWRHVRESVLQSRENEREVDISDGHMFPWWLLLGGTGRQNRLLDRGVTRVVLSGSTLKVTLLAGRPQEVAVESERYGRLQMNPL